MNCNALMKAARVEVGGGTRTPIHAAAAAAVAGVPQENVEYLTHLGGGSGGAASRHTAPGGRDREAVEGGR